MRSSRAADLHHPPLRPAPVIEAIKLTKTYGRGGVQVEALRGIDMAASAGELIAIVGPSGSGKSTLLTLLGAIENPSSGQVLLEGIDLASLDDDQRTLLRRRRLGFVFQAFNLLPMLSALENIALPLELDGVACREARERAEEALQLVDMAHRPDHLPSMLSGGEQQRVAIARALVIRPALVLADEPTGNLDSASGTRILQLLRQLVKQQQETVIVVTHDAEVAATADRIVRLRDGQLDHAGLPVREKALL